jgi:phage terminase small subunit
LNLGRVVRETAAISFSDAARLFGNDGKMLHPTKMDRDTRAAIAEYTESELDLGVIKDGESKGRILTRKVKFWDKPSALEKLFKHGGLYERHNRQRSDSFLDLLPRDVAKLLIQKLRGLGCSTPPMLERD